MSSGFSNWLYVMSQNSNGPSAQDPFFERMLDERISTLKAFLRMTAEKYDVPLQSNEVASDASHDCEEPVQESNVIPLRRAR